MLTAFSTPKQKPDPGSMSTFIHSLFINLPEPFHLFRRGHFTVIEYHGIFGPAQRARLTRGVYAVTVRYVLYHCFTVSRQPLADQLEVSPLRTYFRTGGHKDLQ